MRLSLSELKLIESAMIVSGLDSEDAATLFERIQKEIKKQATEQEAAFNWLSSRNSGLF